MVGLTQEGSTAPTSLLNLTHAIIPSFKQAKESTLKTNADPSCTSSLRKTMPPTNVAVPRKSSWTSETLPRLPSVTKGKSLFEKEMELEQHLMKNLLIRGNGSKPIQIVQGLMGTNSLYGLLSASQGQSRSYLFGL
ncbi:hypothetical protein ACP275_13G052900 [Erythranthe tilingii]